MPYISFYKNELQKIIPGTSLKDMAICVLEDDNVTQISMYGMELYNKARFINDLLPVNVSVSED
jgi:hypothetical protein